MIDKLDSLSGLAGVVLREASKRSSNSSQVAAAESRSPSKQSGADSSLGLRAYLLVRLGPLLRDRQQTPLSLRKALIREILLWRFGSAVAEHGTLKGLLDEFESLYANSPQMAARFEQAYRELSSR